MTFPRYLLYLLPIGVIILESCAAFKEMPQYELPYFEGKVTYEISYESLSENPLVIKTVRSESPNKSVLFYQNGNYIKEHYFQDSLVRTTMYLVDSCMTYYSYPGSDTIMCASAKLTSANTDMIKYDDGDTVLGYKTSSISTLMTGKKGSKIEGQHFKQVYHNCLDLPIDPNHFKDFSEGKYNEFVLKYPGISLKNEMSFFPFYKEIEVATLIEQKVIEISFELDSTKVYIEQKIID